MWKDFTPSCPLTSMYHAYKINTFFFKVHKEATKDQIYLLSHLLSGDHLLQDLEAKV